MLTNGNFKQQEFLDVVQQPFSFEKNRTPCRRGDHERRTREGGGKIKASKLDIKDLSPKKSPSMDSDASYITGDQGLVRNSVFTSAEISVRDKVENPTATSHEWRRDDNPVFMHCEIGAGDKSGFKHGETSARNSESSHNDEVGPPNSGSLWWSVRGDTSWTKVQWEFDSLQEQQLRCSQYVGSWITQRLILNQHHEILNVSNDWVALSLPGWNLPCCMTK